VADANEFQINTLQFLSRFVRNGRTDILAELGIDVEEMRLINELTSHGVHPATKMPKIISKIELDQDALAHYVRQLRVSAQSDECMCRLLLAGATYEMLNHFFGVSKQDVSTKRKLLNIDPPAGRPTNRSTTGRTHEDLVLLDMVSQQVATLATNDRHSATHQCDVMLSIAELTKLSVAIVWKTVEHAVTRGEFSWTD